MWDLDMPNSLTMDLLDIVDWRDRNPPSIRKNMERYILDRLVSRGADVNIQSATYIIEWISQKG